MDDNDSNTNWNLDNAKIKLIQDTLIEQLESPSLYESLIQRYTPRILKIFNNAARVSLENYPEDIWSALDVIAPDRPGLLAMIGQFFMTQDIMLHKAKIATLGERVEDTFYITEKDGERIVDSARIKQICLQLEEKIDLFSQAN